MLLSEIAQEPFADHGVTAPVANLSDITPLTQFLNGLENGRSLGDIYRITLLIARYIHDFSEDEKQLACHELIEWHNRRMNEPDSFPHLAYIVSNLKHCMQTLGCSLTGRGCKDDYHLKDRQHIANILIERTVKEAEFSGNVFEFEPLIRKYTYASNEIGHPVTIGNVRRLDAVGAFERAIHDLPADNASRRKWETLTSSVRSTFASLRTRYKPCEAIPT